MKTARNKFKRELHNVSALLEGWGASLFYRGTHLRNLTLAITYRCNARCKFCNIWQHPELNDSEPMTLDELETLAGSKLLSKVFSLGLTGGEPLLRPDLPDIVSIFSRLPSIGYISLATNGLQPDNYLERLQAVLQRTTKEVWFNVSIDGHSSTQDKVRGVKNAGKLALETLARCAELRKEHPHLGVGILFTITANNIQESREIVALAESLDVQLSLNLLHEGEAFYNNVGGGYMDAYKPMKKNLNRALAAVASTRKGSSLTLWIRKFLHRYLNEERDPPLRCFAGTSSAYISPYGDVYPCVPAPRSFRIGNLRESSLDDIWSSAKAKSVRNAIRKNGCQCLLTCELAHNLKYHLPYHVRRLKKAFPFGSNSSRRQEQPRA